MADSNSLHQLVFTSFLDEVNALKPGNVSQYSDGHGMKVADFKRSAELVTPILCNPTLSVGQCILDCVQMINTEVGCNTNLGMLLLFAPIIKAFEINTVESSILRDNLRKVLQTLDNSEAVLICNAIKLANPGGLGNSERHDVNHPISADVLEIMAESQDKDSIARQYITNFKDIFSVGLNTIKHFNRRWNSVEWAAVACYLTFLAELPDSHIQRKYGLEVAENIRKKACFVAEDFKTINIPEDAKPALLEFDMELKNANINPGTSADLTAASLLVYRLTVKNNNN